MDSQTIKSYLWKWIKRILYTFLGLFILMIIIYIFAPKEMRNPPQQNQTGSILLPSITNTWNTIIISSGSTNTGILVSSRSLEVPKSITGSLNTWLSVVPDTKVAEESKIPTDEAKRKEAFNAWQKIQHLSDQEVFNLYPSNQKLITLQEKGDYIQKVKKEEYAKIYKQYNILEENFYLIIAEAESNKWKWSLAFDQEKQKEIQKYIDSHKIYLWVFCKMLVKDELKSPSTADFPWADFNIIATPDEIVVNSYVDAENTFGAKIRNHLKCYIDYNNADPISKKVELY